MFKQLRNPLGLAIAATFAGLNGGCDFVGAPVPISPEYATSKWQSVSLTEPYASLHQTVYGDDLFQVRHGASCASALSAVSADNAGNYSYGVGLDESISVPAGYNSATVFLNGWRLKYKSQDHEVLGLATAIVDIEQADNTLNWTAGGVLSDKNGDDDFAWCYYYTVLLWDAHPLNLDAIAYDSDADAGLTFVGVAGAQTYQMTGNLLEDFDDVPGALLPRGFGMLRRDRDDHHLGRFALKYGDPFIYTSEDGSGSDVWWQFETLFSDSAQNGHEAAEVVSVLNGDSVEVIQGEFDIVPGQQHGSPGYHDVISNTIVVENIPYDYAVPMLTGWNIGLNSNSDSHIQDIGVWIESFEYDKAPDAQTGTLTYTIKSVFHDKGSNGAGVPDYQVSILGLNPKGLIIQNPTPTTGTVNDDPLPTPRTTTNSAPTTGTVGGFGGSTSGKTGRTTTGGGRFGATTGSLTTR